MAKTTATPAARPTGLDSAAGQEIPEFLCFRKLGCLRACLLTYPGTIPVEWYVKHEREFHEALVIAGNLAVNITSDKKRWRAALGPLELLVNMVNRFEEPELDSPTWETWQRHAQKLAGYLNELAFRETLPMLHPKTLEILRSSRLISKTTGTVAAHYACIKADDRRTAERLLSPQVAECFHIPSFYRSVVAAISEDAAINKLVQAAMVELAKHVLNDRRQTQAATVNKLVDSQSL